MSATSSYKSFLMQGTGTDGSLTYAKLIDVVDIPDFDAAPDALDATTLSDGVVVNIPGIKKADAMSFTANYDATNYDAIKALETAGKELNFAVWFGGTEGSDGTVTPTGSEGTFTFKGYISIFVKGVGVNAVRQMTITIMKTTPVTKVSA